MPSGETDPLIAAIARLGFSELEASTYHALLRAPGSTGYGIAKRLGKPHANVYQALAGLEKKGAVLFEDESKRSYSAVPPSEVFARLRRRFHDDTIAVEEALSEIDSGDQGTERLFHLTSRQQVVDRAQSMIEKARECILVYASPNDFTYLRSSLSAAIARGVCVTGIMMREEDLLPGSKLFRSRVADKIVDRWGNLPMSVVVDACELLISEMLGDRKDVGEAIWTRNRLISALFHNGMVSDIVLHSLPALDRITSPNTHLLGRIPCAITELFVDRFKVNVMDPGATSADDAERDAGASG